MTYKGYSTVAVLALLGVIAVNSPPMAKAQSGVATASWADPATWTKVLQPTETKDIIYFPADAPGYAPKSQVLDVYQNATTPNRVKAPVLVYMHGGAWNHGQKPESWHGFRAWMAAGFTVVTVEYRLVDVAPAPAAVQDVRCALSWVAQNAAKYNFDADRVVTYGTSAGGHLALMAAVLPAKNNIDLPQCTQQPHISAVLDFYGPYHLEQSAIGAFPSPSVARWMGPDPQPSLEAKEHAMSPATYIRPGIPPVFFAHGDADPVVPYQSDLQKKKTWIRRVSSINSILFPVVGMASGHPVKINALNSTLSSSYKKMVSLSSSGYQLYQSVHRAKVILCLGQCWHDIRPSRWTRSRPGKLVRGRSLHRRLGENSASRLTEAWGFGACVSHLQ